MTLNDVRMRRKVPAAGPAAPVRVTEQDTGLGTTYERWALNRYLASLHESLGLRDVFEGPGDGMTGIAGLNSLVLGARGLNVSLLLPERQQARLAYQAWGLHAARRPQIISQWNGKNIPFDTGQFDLAWNFNVLNQAVDPLALLKEMARVSRRYVLVCVPNRRNYSFGLHRLHHRITHQPWDHGPPIRLGPDYWKDLFRRVGLQPVSTGWVDCPWWPDIVDMGQLISDFFPALSRLAEKARPANRSAWDITSLPYYRLELYPEIAAQIKRHSFFETSSVGFLKQLFAHHVCILGAKGPAS